MDQNLVHALRDALKEADFDAAAMVEETVATWKNPAPANATTMTRNKLRNFTKKKKAWAENEMGNRFFIGYRGVHQSNEEAAKWWEKAARHGHAEAQCNLGLMYSKGKGVPQSFQKAIEYYELSARQGYAAPECSLGVMYYYGLGVEKDWNKAREWWTRAAKHGNEDASKELQDLDDEEEEERKRNETTNEKETTDEEEREEDVDEEEKKEETKEEKEEKEEEKEEKQEEKQNATKESESLAGQMVPTVQTVPLVAVWKNSAPANAQTMTRNKLRNFTKKKKAWAEFEMGDRYYRGVGGLHQSYEEAAKWYAKAAKQGHAAAQSDLGDMYDNGEGVPQSYQKAIEYYELSARQGNADAENNLGVMFYEGRDVETDWNRARDWLTRAAKHGNDNTTWASKNLQELDEEEEKVRKRNKTMDKKESVNKEEREEREEDEEKEEETKETSQQPDIDVTITTTTPLPIITPTTLRSWFCEWCFKEHTTEHLLLGCTRCNLVVYCDEECQKIHWMRHRPNCVEDYCKANDIKVSISTLVAYDHAALMDQEDKYRHGVDCFMVVDQIKLNKKKKEEEDAGSEKEEEEKKRQ